MDKVHLYRDEQNEWRWRRVHENGNVLSDSAEGYKNFSDIEKIAKDVNSEAEFVVDE